MSGLIPNLQLLMVSVVIGRTAQDKQDIFRPFLGLLFLPSDVWQDLIKLRNFEKNLNEGWADGTSSGVWSVSQQSWIQEQPGDRMSRAGERQWRGHWSSLEQIDDQMQVISLQFHHELSPQHKTIAARVKKHISIN